MAAIALSAGQLTDEDGDFAGFGPTVVRMHHGDGLPPLDDAYSAVEIAQRMHPRSQRSCGRERLPRHLVTVAHPCAASRDRQRAVRA